MKPEWSLIFGEPPLKADEKPVFLAVLGYGITAAIIGDDIRENRSAANQRAQCCGTPCLTYYFRDWLISETGVAPGLGLAR